MSRWPNAKQKEITFRYIDYNPFPQQAQFHYSKATVLQLVGAEGAGKSWVASSELAACIPWCELIYIIGQTYDNTHPEFNYLVEHLSKLGAVNPAKVSQPKQGSWEMVTETGCRIVTLSVERGASAIIAKGEQPDIICLTEAGIINSYGVVLASVRRATRAKGRVILVGTLKDNYGWYAEMVDELSVTDNQWRGETYSLPAWINTTLYPGGRDDPEIKRLEAIMPDDEFARTIAAERVPSRALVLSEFRYSQHVKPCPFNPDLPVTIWIDPGHFPSVYAVLAVQFHGREVWHFDEVFLNDHIHDQVIEICKQRPWWKKVEGGVIDFAGRQHHADRSAIEVWQARTGLSLRSQLIGIMDGIYVHRAFLKQKRLYHDPSCKGTLGEYGLYRLPTDRDGNPTSDQPRDEHNHAMKAIAYGLVDRFGFVEGMYGYVPNPMAGYRG